MGLIACACMASHEELSHWQDVLDDELHACLSLDHSVGHIIELDPSARPPNRPVFRLSESNEKEVFAAVNELLAKDLTEATEPSTSPYGAPEYLVCDQEGWLPAHVHQLPCVQQTDYSKVLSA